MTFLYILIVTIAPAIAGIREVRIITVVSVNVRFSFAKTENQKQSFRKKFLWLDWR